MATTFQNTITKMFYGPYEFIPVPLITWTTTLQKSSQDESLFLENTIELDGTLCNFASESGAFTELMDKRQELVDAVTASGLEFRITHEGGAVSGADNIFPTLESVSFEPGTWTEQIPYTVSFTYNEEIEGKAPVENFSETWNFQENEDRRSVTITHEVSAVGINTGVSGANNSLANARTFVLDKTSYGNVPSTHPVFVQASGLLPSGLDLVAFEGLRSENVDVQAGSFGVVENFILSSGNFTHLQNTNFATDNDGVTIVSIDGTVTGLGRGDICFVNALSAFNNKIEPALPGKAQQVYSQFAGSGTLFVQRPLSRSMGSNEFAGTITYNKSYNDDPGSDLPSDIQDASCQAVNSEPTQVYATIPICQRPEGPVVQNVQTTKPGTYTVSGSVTAKAGVDIAEAVAYAQTLINSKLPTASVLGHTLETLILTGRSITKNELKRTVSFSVNWQYTARTFAQAGSQFISC